MVRVSFVLGIIAAVAGLMAIGFGIPIQAFGLGNTLIGSGATVFSAGLVVITLSMVLRAIERLAQELPRPVAVEPSGGHASFEHQPVETPAQRSITPPQNPPDWPPAAVTPPHDEAPHPPQRREPRRPPMPARSGWQDEEAAPVPPLPAGARPPGAPPPRLEREPVLPPQPERDATARPRLPGRAERPPREPVMERLQQAHEAERRREPVSQGEERDEGGQEPRVDPYAPPERRRVFGWTRRSKERRDEAGESGGRATEPGFGAPASAAGRAPQDHPAERRELPRAPLRGAPPEPRERPASPPAPAAPQAAPAPRAAASQPRASEPEPAAAEEAPPVAVLKQGTVDGMAYTLYTDGSIDAEFPEGRIRFNSIDELRQHLESQQD